MGNKKCITTFEFMLWVLRIIFLVAVMFSIMILIRSYITTTIDISELQGNLLAYRMIYSPNSISNYDSEINRTYPGIIDVRRFESQNAEKFLEKSAYYGKDSKEAGARLLLKGISNNEERTIYYNEDFFKEQKKLVDSGFTEGPGGAKGYTKKYNVVMLSKGSLSRGMLTVDVVIPNS